MVMELYTKDLQHARSKYELYPDVLHTVPTVFARFVKRWFFNPLDGDSFTFPAWDFNQEKKRIEDFIESARNFRKPSVQL